MIPRIRESVGPARKIFLTIFCEGEKAPFADHRDPGVRISWISWLRRVTIVSEISQLRSREILIKSLAPSPLTVTAPSSVFLSADRLRRTGRASRNYTIGWAMQ